MLPEVLREAELPERTALPLPEEEERETLEELLRETELLLARVALLLTLLRATDVARVAEPVLAAADERVAVVAELRVAELARVPAAEEVTARLAAKDRLGLTACVRPLGMTEGCTAPPPAGKKASRWPRFMARPFRFQCRPPWW